MFNKNALLFDLVLTAVGAGTVNHPGFDTTMADDILAGAAISVIAAGSLDIKFQWSPDRHQFTTDAAATWFDLPGATFTSIVAAGNTSKALIAPVGRWMRLVNTIVTGPVTGRIFVEGTRRS